MNVETIAPNVLLVMVDQMRLPRWFPVGERLPAYDRLRAEGLSFENAFACANPCSPSRASIVTGLHYAQHGICANVAGTGTRGIASLDPCIPTYGHAFRRVGYRTPYVGKWHLSTPDDYADLGLERYGFEGWHGPDREGHPLQGLREDADVASEAIAWLGAHAARGPWFLTCSFVNPHDIMFFRRTQPPEDCPRYGAPLPASFRDDLSTKPRIQARYQAFWGQVMGMSPDQPEDLWRHYGDFYLYLTKKVDAEVARVLAALDASDVAGRTITVFVSDHGEMAGAHMLQGKGPFVYHENVQVPLVFRWPGRIAAGRSTAALAQGVDLFPTLLELTGAAATPEHLPGRSLSSLLVGADPHGPNEHVLLSWGMTARRMQGEPPRARGSGGEIPDEVRGLFDGRSKVARYFADDGEEELELYDLREDPYEMRNLAGDAAYVGLRREMTERLRAAEAAEMAPRDVPLATADG